MRFHVLRTGDVDAKTHGRTKCHRFLALFSPQFPVDASGEELTPRTFFRGGQPRSAFERSLFIIYSAACADTLSRNSLARVKKKSRQIK